MAFNPDWTPDQCRAARWGGHPIHEGNHGSHLFYYGENDKYVGNCKGGNQRKDQP